MPNKSAASVTVHVTSLEPRSTVEAGGVRVNRYEVGEQTVYVRYRPLSDDEPEVFTVDTGALVDELLAEGLT